MDIDIIDRLRIPRKLADFQGLGELQIVQSFGGYGLRVNRIQWCKEFFVRFLLVAVCALPREIDEKTKLRCMCSIVQENG